ncbi:hypothetical protein AB0L00_23035 [Actinoallomurus sp. NPDC052308]|uniref:hypothetical protein n=1 Tax=Actinoallomurus sp. NPDC052308 TaxID=3155530 RepID=UPI003449384D
MNMIVRRVSLAVAGAAVTAGVAGPMSAAHADEPLPCPRIFGVVCAFTGPHGHGHLRLIHQEERFLAPPVRSAQNQDARPWCLYDHPDFNGESRELAHGQSIGDLGFEASSARPGNCTVR